MNETRWHTLLEHALENELSSAEADEFSFALKTRSEAIDDYIGQMYVHEMIAKHPESLRFVPCANPRRQGTVSRWRWFLAAAAGIALLLSGSIALHSVSWKETALAHEKTVASCETVPTRSAVAVQPVVQLPQEEQGKGICPDVPSSCDIVPVNVSQPTLGGAIAAERKEEMKKTQLAAAATAAALSVIPAVKTVASQPACSALSAPHYIDARDRAAEVSALPHFIEARLPVKITSKGVRKSVIDTSKPLGTVVMLM